MESMREKIQFLNSDSERRKLKEFDVSAEGNARMWQILHEKKKLSWERALKSENYQDVVAWYQRERSIPHTDRTFSEIAACYDMTKSEFLNLVNGKSILDIGAGLSDFAQVCITEGNARSAAVFDTEENNVKARKHFSEVTYFSLEEADRMQERFDFVFANYSLPFWASSGEELKHFFNTVQRFTNEKVFIAPVASIELRPVFGADGTRISQWELNAVFQKLLARLTYEEIDQLELLEKSPEWSMQLGYPYLQEATETYTYADIQKNESPSYAIITRVQKL